MIPFDIIFQMGWSHQLDYVMILQSIYTYILGIFIK